MSQESRKADESVTRMTKKGTLRWSGYVERMNEESVNRINGANVHGRISQGRPRHGTIK